MAWVASVHSVGPAATRPSCASHPRLRVQPVGAVGIKGRNYPEESLITGIDRLNGFSFLS